MPSLFFLSNHACSTLQEKLALLQSQLCAIEDGTDPEYLTRIREVDKMREHRLFVAETFRDYELAVTTADYNREKETALEQYEAKKLELKDYLLHDLQDKRRAYDNYRNTVELSNPGDHHSYVSGHTHTTRYLCLPLTHTISFPLTHTSSQSIALNQRQWSHASYVDDTASLCPLSTRGERWPLSPHWCTCWMTQK